jgi:hypothetical protein
MNVKIIDFTKYEVAEISCWQYDYGQLVQLIFPENLSNLQVQWNHEDGFIDPRIIYEEAGLFFAKIPNKGLEKPNSFVGYVYKMEEEFGQTLFQIKVKVRVRPPIEESITEDELSVWQQLIIDTIDAKEQALAVPDLVWNSIFQQGEEYRNFWESWSPEHFYKLGNKVEYEGSSYVALEDNYGVIPPENMSFWQLIAAKGSDALPGEKEDKNYVHQQISPSNNWIIEHNFGKIPSVSIFEGTELNVTNPTVFGQITHLDLNTVQVEFSKAIYGFANLN